ncbi:MAG: hypothetical protein JSU65_05365 [Candidatus Zixiibacteriota bacterium]|nr:MAG: hypothetical protein JSU65_05365 [candidate division Zixibacteria bacterium]
MLGDGPGSTTIVLGAAAACVLLAAVSCGSGETRCTWASRTPQIDGRTDDWDESKITVVKEDAILTALCNDADNLYVLVKTKDLRAARAIRMGGLTLRLGSDNDTLVLTARDGPSLVELVELEGEDQARQMTEDRLDRLYAMEDRIPRALAVTDSVGRPVQVLSPDGSDGPTFAYDISRGFFNYEFSIPLHSTPTDWYGLSAAPGDVISADIVYGGRRWRGDRRGRPGRREGDQSRLDTNRRERPDSTRRRVRTEQDSTRRPDRPGGRQALAAQSVSIRLTLATRDR